jgi:O-antigen/teichoic acid export membrane protein
MSSDDDRGLIRAWAITLSRHVGVALVALGWTALTARNLGPDGTGLVLVATTLPALLAPVVNLGLPTAIGWLTAQRRYSNSETVGASLMAGFALGLGATVVVAGGLAAVGSLFGRDVTNLLLGSIGLFPYVVLSVVAALYLGREHFGLYAVTLIGGPLLALLVALFTFIFAGVTVVTLVLIWISSHLVIAIISFLHLRRGTAWPSWSTMFAYLSDALRYGWKVWIGEAAVSGRARLDLFLIAWLVGSTAAGLFGTAVQMAAQVGILSQAAYFVVFPVMAQVDKSEDDRRRQTPMIARLTFAFSLVVALVVALLGPQLIEILFGSEFRGAFATLVWYLPAAVLLSISRVLTADISARGRPDIVMVIALGTLALSVVLNLAFIPRFGSQGAAAAASLTAVVNLWWRASAYRRLSDVNWRSLVFPRRPDFALIGSYFKRS